MNQLQEAFFDWRDVADRSVAFHTGTAISFRQWLWRAVGDLARDPGPVEKNIASVERAHQVALGTSAFWRSPLMIVTFYSYKGGVGRSMAMVNVAEVLVRRGYSVVLCDWDSRGSGAGALRRRRQGDRGALARAAGHHGFLLDDKAVMARPSSDVSDAAGEFSEGRGRPPPTPVLVRKASPSETTEEGLPPSADRRETWRRG